MSQSQIRNRSSIAFVTHFGEQRSRIAWMGSILLHVAIIGATFFSFAHRLEIADQTPPVVPVELVTLGEKTNIQAQVKETPPPKVQPSDKFTPVAPDQPTEPNVPPPEEQAEAAPPPPETAPSEPEIAPKPPTPTPVQKPKERPKPEKKKEFDVNNVLALLNKVAPTPQKSNAKKGERNIRGIGDQSAMTMDLVDSLRNQISQCWSPPVGAPNADELAVTMEVYLNPDGSVARPPQLTAQSHSGGPFIQAAIDAAKRAIYVCAPYKLPADRYSQWRDIEFEFNPRAMMGQ